MITTASVDVIRGQTWTAEGYIKNGINRPVDLTGGTVFTWVRADLKVDAQIKLASTATTGHRVGILIAVDQTGADRGKFTITMIPSDTINLVAAGSDDPYFYDIWFVDATGAKYPVISLSVMNLWPQVTTTP